MMFSVWEADWETYCVLCVYEHRQVNICNHTTSLHTYKLDVESRKLRTLESRRGPGL